MPNTSVRAAAEGMPEINRRRLLLGLAAASTAAATVTVATDAMPAENLELLRLADTVSDVEAEFVSARDARRAIVAEWSPRWPALPSAIVGTRLGGYSDIARDLVGDTINGPANKFGETHSLKIATVESVEWYQERARRVLKGRGIDKRKLHGMDRAGWEDHLAYLDRVSAVAARYEAKCKKVRAASGIVAATERRRAAFAALTELTHIIMAQEPVTMSGIVAQAQALAAFGRHADAWDVAFVPGASTWGTELAANVLRLAGAVS